TTSTNITYIVSVNSFTNWYYPTNVTVTNYTNLGVGQSYTLVSNYTLTNVVAAGPMDSTYITNFASSNEVITNLWVNISNMSWTNTNDVLVNWALTNNSNYTTTTNLTYVASVSAFTNWYYPTNVTVTNFTNFGVGESYNSISN